MFYNLGVTVNHDILFMTLNISGGLVHELPPDLQSVIIESNTLAHWEALTPIARNEFICWIEGAKQAKTRTKRITRAVESLKEGKKRPCCWPGCIHRTDKAPSKWQQNVLLDKQGR